MSGHSQGTDRTPRDDWNESTYARDTLSGRHGPRAYAYLLVLEGDTSRVATLPASGEIVIGRGQDVELKLGDTTVSRRHARVSVAEGEATLVDLDSQNGTLLNGQPISGARQLMSGDTITICGVSIIYQASSRTSNARTVLDLAGLRRRMEEEIERSLRFSRPLTIAMISLGAGADRERVMQVVSGQLRLVDVIGSVGSAQLVVVMPETDSADAPAAGSRLVDVVSQVAPDVRLGTATCPADGCDVDTLLASARAAAQAAAPAQVAAAGDTYSTRQVGDMVIVVADPAMIRLFSLIERVASSDLPVLICGETGTGKEVAATALHHWSRRAIRPLVTLNCAALPENLIESELFGHEKGAFSGATAAKAGLLETASEGTLLLDEVGELGASAQAKLLRVLETKRVTRVGSVVERQISIRIVAATNRDLDEEVKRGAFRRDLFFRLSGATIWLPPLRDRKRELPILAQRFLDEACVALNRVAMRLSAEAIGMMAVYDWPGNVRELKNAMEYAAATSHEDTVSAADLAERLRVALAEPGSGQAPGTEPVAGRDPVEAAAPLLQTGEQTRRLALPLEPDRQFRPIGDELRDLERNRMREALEAAGGNQTRAAELISMPLRTFATKVKQYGLGRRSSDR